MLSVINFRACNKCKADFPVTEEFYQAISNSTDGFRKTCLKCKSHSDRQRYLSKREQVISRASAWYQQNKEAKKLYDQQYRENNRARRNEVARLLYQKIRTELPARYKASAILISNSGRFEKQYKITARDLQRMFHRQRQRCFYCGNPFTDILDLEIDHVVPAARGGKNSIGNLVMACRPCNRHKSTKTIMELRTKKIVTNHSRIKL